MLPLCTALPPFELPEPLTGKIRRSDEFQPSPLLLVAFICNHCPYVVHLKDALVQFARDYEAHLQVVAISSNSVESHPQDGPELMAEDARRHSYPFPYLYDASQEVAKAFHAACTPDFFLFNFNRILVYRGQFDNTRPSHRTAPDTPDKGATPDGADLRRAVQAALKGETIPPEEQKSSLGCNIKWHPGNEPDYS